MRASPRVQPTITLPSEDETQKRRVSAQDPLEVQISNLQALINSPPQNSRVIDVTPDLAQWILTDLNTNNRPRKFAKIRDFAEDMAAGEWGLTGDTIKFSRGDGVLRDGQNRLIAVVKSSATIRTHVVFGIDPRLFVRMDIGKNRNNADILSIMGAPHASRVAQTARWIMILTGENPKNRAISIKNDEMQKYYRETVEPDSDAFQHSIEISREVNTRLRHPVGPVAALHYLFSKMASTDEADRFMMEWATGVVRNKRAPTRMLQDRLQQIAADSSGRVHELVRIGLICKAWVAWRAKRASSKTDMLFDVQSDEFAVDFRGVI